MAEKVATNVNQANIFKTEKKRETKSHVNNCKQCA